MKTKIFPPLKCIFLLQTLKAGYGTVRKPNSILKTTPLQKLSPKSSPAANTLAGFFFWRYIRIPRWSKAVILDVVQVDHRWSTVFHKSLLKCSLTCVQHSFD